MNKVLIVGGVAGGASAAARLRRLDEKAEIIMFEKGGYISFANCGLPYYIGGDITEKESLTLQTPESFHNRFRVDVRVNQEVISIYREQKQVEVKNLKTGESYKESYDYLILSPGAEPIKPDIVGIESIKQNSFHTDNLGSMTDSSAICTGVSKRVFTLRNIPDTYRIKDYITNTHAKSAVIVGGGYIGVEMAENLHKAGVKVTIVEYANHVIGPLDYDMACDVHQHIREQGVTLILEDGVKEIRETNKETGRLEVLLGKGILETDMVILSVGVRPESNLAKGADLTINKRGAIIVNEQMQTNDPFIYAVGDVVEVKDYVTKDTAYIPLAGPANKQGRIAADNICGIQSKYKGTQGTGILKCFDMTVATTGITEAKAKQLELNYEKSFTYSASHASYYPEAVNMSVKILFNKEDGKLLGAQIVGFEGVDKRLDVLAVALRMGMTVYDLTELELAYAPPYSSAKDPVNMAGFTAENILTGKVNVFHWNQFETIKKDSSAFLLDVRTQLEYENGAIEGFHNIPLDELRSHIDKIDQSKTVYVTCQVGLRGYIACRMLSQSGFKCYNLSGGYRLYNSIYKNQSIIPYRKQEKPMKNTVREEVSAAQLNLTGTTIKIDACGLQCPGPVMKLSEAVKNAQENDRIEIKTTDPAFAADVEAWCRRTGNVFEGVLSEKGIATAMIRKNQLQWKESNTSNNVNNNKNLIVFSGDLDKAIASFIIANAAASMGRKVTMFFTFWGLNILRKPKKVSVKKDMISKMFGMMMPRGSKKLSLSKMNMGGIGAKMIRSVMKNKNVDSLESLIAASIENGVELVACSMSMDVMGIKMEELIDGVKPGGAAAMLANAEESDMSLFI